jgi:hypothetical protein
MTSKQTVANKISVLDHHCWEGEMDVDVRVSLAAVTCFDLHPKYIVKEIKK